jgi:hypothetical protein
VRHVGVLVRMPGVSRARQPTGVAASGWAPGGSATISDPVCCRLRSGVIVRPCLLSRAVLRPGRTALTRSLRSALPMCAAPGRNRGAWHTPFTAIVKIRCGWFLSSTGPTPTRCGHISGYLHLARSCSRSRPSPPARPSFRSTRRAPCPCKGGRPARRRCTAGRAGPAHAPVHFGKGPRPGHREALRGCYQRGTRGSFGRRLPDWRFRCLGSVGSLRQPPIALAARTDRKRPEIFSQEQAPRPATDRGLKQTSYTRPV